VAKIESKRNGLRRVLASRNGGSFTPRTRYNGEFGRYEYSLWFDNANGGETELTMTEREWLTAFEELFNAIQETK